MHFNSFVPLQAHGSSLCPVLRRHFSMQPWHALLSANVVYEEGHTPPQLDILSIQLFPKGILISIPPHFFLCRKLFKRSSVKNVMKALPVTNFRESFFRKASTVHLSTESSGYKWLPVQPLRFIFVWPVMVHETKYWNRTSCWKMAVVVQILCWNSVIHLFR